MATVSDSDQSLDLTLTPCALCNQVSEENEGMVHCDFCKGWFHYRCVGVSDDVKKEKMWFCSAVACQQAYSEYLKKQEVAAKRKKAKKDDVSAKSDSIAHTLENRMKELERQEKAKDDELEIETALRVRKLALQKARRMKQLAIENDLRKMELEQEEELNAKALKEKEDHLAKLEEMRASFSSKLTVVQGKIDKMNDSLHETKDGMKPKAQKLKLEKKPKARAKFDQQNSDTEWTSSGDSKCTDSLSESSDTDISTEIEKEPKNIRNDKSNGLGPQPSQAQLMARSGISRKLPVFTGKAEDWPLFISSFNSSTIACGYTEVENLVRLQESIQGDALENVRGQLLFPKSVPKAIRKLRQLYGRPEQLLRYYLDKVRQLESPKADKLHTYIPFGNTVEQLCEHLEAAELKEHLLNPILIQDLVDKLPACDKREWVRYKKRKQSADLRVFSKFLSRIVGEACEASVSFNSKSDSKVFGNARNKEKVFSHDVAQEEEPCELPTRDLPARDQSTSNLKPCKVCKSSNHRLRDCQEFKEMSVLQRLELVEKWKLCHICLNDHGKSWCRFKIRCDIGDCQERHNPLLHKSIRRVVMNTHFRSNSSILFRIIPVILHYGRTTIKTTAFLDDGSSATLVEQSLADELGVVGQKEPLTITWTADVSRVEENSMRMNLKISSCDDNELWCLNGTRTVNELKLPKQSMCFEDLIEKHAHLRGLPIQSYSGTRPGLLIGLNNLHLMAPLETKMGDIGDPIAVRSKLGWAIYGPVGRQHSHNDSEFFGVHVEVSNEELHDLIKLQYTLEEATVSVVRESPEDVRARQILEKTTIRVGDRFETGLLWNTDDPKFPDNYHMAARRAKQLEHRLLKTPELFENVCQQIKDYQEKDYAYEASSEELVSSSPNKSWYLPLNVVLNPKKPGKVRLVWDAAATVSGVSLNSQLLKGPDMLVSLPAVINRFRERRIAFGADIREMYHQLQIRKEDRQAQRFLFRNDQNERFKTFVMDVATFGSTCSPCSAQFVKNRNAEEFVKQYPEAVAAIIGNHYVDDYYDSTDTEDQAVDRALQVKYIHSKGGFELRNWVSNAYEVLKRVGEPKAEQIVHFNQDKVSDTERVLGIIWDPEEDVFSFSTDHREDIKEYLENFKKPTKRVVLSCVMGFFDPLGLLAPFTVHGKTLIQDLWRSGCDWDEELNSECLGTWKRWIDLLPLVRTIRIPRCYLGEIQESTNISAWHWVPSKQNIADALTKWGQGPPLDSNSAWFNGPEFLYEPADQWPKQECSTDIVEDELKSVYMLVHEACSSKKVVIVDDISRWKHILRITATVYRFISNIRRKREGRPILVTKATENQAKLIKAKLESKQCPLQREELIKAETIPWQQAQYEAFPDEVRILKNNSKRKENESLQQLEKFSVLYRLTPMIDDNGVVRMGGRMEQAEHIPFDTKFPIILPKDNVITTRLLQFVHEQCGHGNKETVYNEVCQKFWIPKLRVAIQHIMRECMWCKVYRCKPEIPRMAPLPVQRLSAKLGPFSSVGIDHLGPLEVTVGRRKEKRWVAVFTCLAVRAVHMEIIYSLSTQSCLMAIRRFISKRGTPEEIFSDNGTNFLGSWNQMLKVIDYECAEKVTSPKTKWHFIPPGTPHMGGSWERMVRSVKEALKAFSDGRKLTDEILITALSEAEDLINFRPLTYKSQETTGSEALTPNHFLRVVKPIDMEGDEVEVADALRDIYKRW
ncbi:uncharacterized protein LOC129753928 [Uranotaenia lowii]|uniref:uncharacterized protein LOC129753928 n=1 Tax=Uranotaenia lowii TaxID=190385 RepID=UPI00247B1598|nr:uncharacterized protein LOC129753928 [Uranotaenia lowii]